MSAKSFTERQGQYLAFIDAYTRVHGRPPAETDMQPQPAFRAPDGPHAGAPRPHPPPARRRAQHRGAPRPPRLARSASPPTGQIHCAEELVASHVLPNRDFWEAALRAIGPKYLTSLVGVQG